jgi:hypothetical protein
MRGKWAVLSCILGLTTGIAGAQVPRRTTVDETAMYCSGEVRSEAIPQESFIISGEESITKIAFAVNNLVYINRGTSQGTKVGDEYLVVRPVKELLKREWFRPQMQLMNAMGQPYADLGKLRVVHVGGKVSTAKVVYSCDYMQRGDIILPFAERPAPTLKQNAFIVDPFAPATGKTGMVVMTKGFGITAGNNTIAYVNLGATEGMKVGGYVRVFRDQSNMHDVIYQTKSTWDRLYGFGSTPVAFAYGDLPREIVGEGIVIRVSGHAATVMITAVRREIYAGDFVEMEQ